METKIIEVTNNNRNWGKFMLMRFSQEEWAIQSAIGQGSLLKNVGWNPTQVWVLDLQTCEGAAFVPHGLASADLNKHKVWVCPMYEPFLNWLYEQDLTRLDALPSFLDLPDAEFDFCGYRRPGPSPEGT